MMDENGKPLWDDNFSPPEYLYKIILVCMFFGFILFLIFFALVRYLKFQNKARAILLAQQEREAANFPAGFDGLMEAGNFTTGSGGEMPIVIHTQRESESPTKDYEEYKCTCKAGGDQDSCVCQPLNPKPKPNTNPPVSSSSTAQQQQPAPSSNSNVPAQV